MGAFVPSPSARRFRVLIAEDDDDMRALLVTALQADGYDVIEARDGREAIERIVPMIFGEGPPPPDAIITDVRLPGMSGTTFLAGLRAIGWTTPIIVITAYEIHSARAEAEYLGADAVFGKPFDVDDLRVVLASILGASHR